MQQAIQDIREDLSKEHKCFIAFRTKLNPVMRGLVKEQLRQQSNLNPFHHNSHSNSQHVAHCCFITSTQTSELHDYTKYYDKK